VATNLDDQVKDILAINSQHFKIEDCFRIMKTSFNARPIFHRKRARIIAHFLICYTALLIYRLLEVRLDQYGEHFTTGEIQKTLRNMNVMNVQDVYYAAAYTSSNVCTALNGLFDLGLDKKNYQPKELNKKLKNFQAVRLDTEPPRLLWAAPLHRRVMGLECFDNSPPVEGWRVAPVWFRRTSEVDSQREQVNRTA